MSCLCIVTVALLRFDHGFSLFTFCPLRGFHLMTLPRGAVRERMLFNRLAEGEIELPDYDTQVKASQSLAKIKPMRQAIQQQLKELELLPQMLLSPVFGTRRHAHPTPPAA
jgi:hypothetical protein